MIGISPARASLAGTGVVMACACGAASSTVKLILLAGVGASTRFVHPALIGVGAAFILYGLWRTARWSAYLAAAGFAFFAVGGALTPPGKMSLPASTMAGTVGGWTAMDVFGAAMYMIGAAILAYAFWRAFPSRRPAASATAMGGMAVATGCTCCMVTGAMAGMAVTAGASTAFETMPLIFWSALAAVAAGLYRLGGWRAAIWVPAGAVILKYGPQALRITGDWMVSGVNMRFVPSYLLSIAGIAVILYGFAKAYRAPAVESAKMEELRLAA